jgi:peptide/nickel transport system ATP-binding protein
MSQAGVSTGLVVEGLHVEYVQESSLVHAVSGIDLVVGPGEALGLVGESGSGKSSVAFSILRLLPPTARIRGRISVDGLDLAALSERDMRRVRGRLIGMVFQDPAAALNPVFPVSTQIVDTFLRHKPGLTRDRARRMAGDLVEELGISRNRLASYPHQLSGGMRQRMLIAAAMAAEPAYVVADEPTSDLDTISQNQILRLLAELREQRKLGILLISHDLAVIASFCDNVAVMYRGHIVEVAPTSEIMSRPQHPYSVALLRMSRRDRDASGRFEIE